MHYRRNLPLKPSRFSKLRRPLPIALAGLLLIILVIAVLELTNTTHFFHKKVATSGTIPATTSSQSSEPSPDPDAQGNTPGPTPTNQTTTPVETPKSPGATPTGEPPRVPSGNFVSNHHPSLSNTEESPSKLQSACNTTPGASCTITFTRNGVTKTLESKTANSNGIVIWDWDVKSAGFVEGSWQITASATLNGQTKTAQDAQALEVQS